jgi:hypothetical protein
VCREASQASRHTAVSAGDRHDPGGGQLAIHGQIGPFQATIYRKIHQYGIAAPASLVSSFI